MNGPVAVRWFADLAPDLANGDIFQLRSDIKSLVLAGPGQLHPVEESPVDQVSPMQHRSSVQAVAALIELARTERGLDTISAELVWLRCARGWPYALLEP